MNKMGRPINVFPKKSLPDIFLFACEQNRTREIPWISSLHNMKFEIFRNLPFNRKPFPFAFPLSVGVLGKRYVVR